MRDDIVEIVRKVFAIDGMPLVLATANRQAHERWVPKLLQILLHAGSSALLSY